MPSVPGTASLFGAAGMVGDGTGAPASFSQVLGLGQSAELPSFRIKLVSQGACSSTASSRRSTRLWTVELEITNTTEERLPANPFYATLQDEQGYVYTTSLLGCAPLLPARILGRGETVRGQVPFQLPVGTTSVLLTYRPMLPRGVVQAARFRLEP